MVLRFRLHPELLLGSQLGIPLSVDTVPSTELCSKEQLGWSQGHIRTGGSALGVMGSTVGVPTSLHPSLGRLWHRQRSHGREPWTEIWVWAYYTGTVERLRLDSALGQKSGCGTPTPELMDPECWSSRPPPAPVSWAHGLTPAGCTPGEFYEQTRLFSTGIIIFVI